MKMTVTEEPRKLVESSFAGHAASGRAQVEEMRRGTATYKGVPIKFGYLPKYFSEEGFGKLKADLEHAWRILVRVIEEYMDNPDYRAMFGFPAELEEMILRRPAYRTLLPVCRLDIFLNEDTGDFRFCEFNADGSSAMNENAELYRTYRNTLLYREMDGKYEQVMFELFDSWVEVFLGIWKEAGWGTIIYLAALTSISPELYEAAAVDGAGRFRRIWHVTLPGLRPTIVVLLIMRLGYILGSEFDRPLALTNKLVTDVSTVISIYVYQKGINGGGQFSLTTAVGLFQSVVGVLFLFGANFLAKRFGERGIM